MRDLGAREPSQFPALILAADHRARGVVTIERYADLCAALGKAMQYCDGLLATVQPLDDLRASGVLGPDHRLYLSLNRTGLAGSAFELDDRLVATVDRALDSECHGIKHMTRIDLQEPLTAAALHLLGRVIQESRQAGLEALIEAVSWGKGGMARDTESIIYAAIVAHDMGAPLLKVPIPDEPAGDQRIQAVDRIVGSVGVPVLFLGGPHRSDAERVLMSEVRDVMAGGGAGMAIGRAIYQDPDPAGRARQISEVVHGHAGS